VDPAQWARALTDRMNRLDGVQHDMDLATLQAIAQDRDRQRWLAGIEAGAVAATALLAVVISLRLGRPMVRGLQALRDGAHRVAFDDLPTAVETLRGAGSLTGKTPEEFADQAGEGLTVSGTDEMAAVAHAFNTVRHEAIRTAAEQALLRAGVGATFVALARRGERLTGALTAELDRAERDEQDPDRLARLFVLDHLAARMTRNNESLLVLGGDSTARVRDEGVTLVDVIRGAAGRIERYTRVNLATVDSSVVIAPQAVDHLVHLCAELLDNATAFSSPDSPVRVDGRELADRVIIQITDDGIGMTPEQRAELNRRLSSPRQADISSVRAMGLTVAAQLSSWYEISVELRPRPEGGTIAEITLPTALYWSPGRTQAPAASFGPGSRQASTLGTPDATRVGVRNQDADRYAGPAPSNIAPAPASHRFGRGSHRAKPASAPTAPGPRVALPQYPHPQSTFDAAPVAPGYDGNGPRERPRTTAPSPVSDHRPLSFELLPSGFPGQGGNAAAPGAPQWTDQQSPTPGTIPTVPHPRGTEQPPPSPRLGGPVQGAPAEQAGQPWATDPAQPTPAAPSPATSSDRLLASTESTTIHGLPKRVPLARLPAEALAGPEAPPTSPVDRDPARTSASMASYARGLSGRSPDEPAAYSPYPQISSPGNF
jgi:signal transduction histidine kinase